MLKKIVKLSFVVGAVALAVTGLSKYQIVERSAAACNPATGAGCD